MPLRRFVIYEEHRSGEHRVSRATRRVTPRQEFRPFDVVTLAGKVQCADWPCKSAGIIIDVTCRRGRKRPLSCSPVADMNTNPYESPHASEPSPESAAAPTPNATADDLRPVGRVAIGCLGGIFGSTAVWVAIVSMTGSWTGANLLFIPSWIVIGIVTGWTAYSGVTPLRIATWAIAGLGTGIVLEAILAGGLAVGTWLTLSGMVLGIVFAILGYRRRPTGEGGTATPPS